MRQHGLRHFAATAISLLVCVFAANAQPATIFGKIFSSDEGTVNYASVFFEGTGYNCITDEQGMYRLEAPAGKYVLVVTAIGYETYRDEIEMTEGEPLKHNVRLRPEVTRLDGSVVTGNSIGRTFARKSFAPM